MREYYVITGGARGLGKVISTYFASEGKNLLIIYNTSKESALSLKKELEDKYKVSIYTFKCDISSDNDILELSEFINKNKLNVVSLINNAAVCIDSLFDEKNKENFMNTLEVNIYGTFNISKALGNIMYKNKGGSIVNISSTNGIDKYFPMSIDYDASKAAVNSLTHNLALEFSPYVRVNAIAPGWINMKSEVRDLDDDYIKSEEEKIFVRRFAEPTEIAKVVYFLTSDDASYINNDIIKVDGGTYGD